MAGEAGATGVGVTGGAVSLSEAERRALDALAALQADYSSGEIDERAYERLRRRYEARLVAAAEQEPAAPVVAETSASPARAVARRRRRWRLYVGGCLIFVGLAYVGLVDGLRMRLPGETPTGGVSLSRAQTIARRLAQAATLVDQGNDLLALKTYESVLSMDPSEPVALAYRGWLLAQAGFASGDSSMVQLGAASLAEAESVSPKYPDPHGLLGQVDFQYLHRDSEAVRQFRQFLADQPPPALVKDLGPVIQQAFTADGLQPPALSTTQATG